MENNTNARLWWLHQRIKFNKALMISGMLTFVIYTLFTAQIFGSPYLTVTLNTMMVELIVYVFYMLMANLFYTIGWLSDLAFNTANTQKFRLYVFTGGYCLPYVYRCYL